MSTPVRRITLVCCLAGLVFGLFFTQYFRQELRVHDFEAGALGGAEVFFIPPKPVLRIVSLGRDPFLADMLFLRGNQYFADHLFSDRIFVWLEEYIESILYLEPNNPRVYRWASQVVKYAQHITNAIVRRSTHYAKLGIAEFPNDRRFYMDVGFNLQYELRLTDPEERRRAEEEALEYFTIAASLPNSQLNPNFITELYARKNDIQMALFQAYRNYQDASETERTYLRRRIKSLEGKQAARSLEDEEKRWRERYSFLPLGMYRVFDIDARVRLPGSWSRVDAVAMRGRGTRRDESSRP